MRLGRLGWAVGAVCTLSILAGCASSGGASSGGAKGGPSYALVIEGFEWGPSVTKAVLNLGGAVKAASVTKDAFTVRAGDTERTVKDAYISDKNGNRAEGDKFVTLELAVGYDEKTGPIENSSPFRYDMETSRNVWVPLDIYTIATAEGKTLNIGGKETSVSIAPDRYTGKISPATDGLKKSSFIYKGTAEDIKINTAAWEPEALKTDSGKNPLIIWLHGAGGGSATDVDIALYDNDVTEIFGDTIQSYFKTDGLSGAYVLYPQCATWWMDNGSGEMTSRGPVSRYTEALKAAIDDYLDSNPDVDRNRVYIGGCSNGGYMTVNMMLHYPKFFAAGYPIAEAFASKEISEEALKSLAEEPLWFVVAADDPVVAPVQDFTLDTYVRLVRAGAKNAHLSYYENVTGQDAPDVRYIGHFSWIYTLQDRTLYDQNAVSVKVGGLAALSTASQTPVLVNGSPVSLWAWLASQKLE